MRWLRNVAITPRAAKDVDDGLLVWSSLRTSTERTASSVSQPLQMGQVTTADVTFHSKVGGKKTLFFSTGSRRL